MHERAWPHALLARTRPPHAHTQVVAAAHLLPESMHHLPEHHRWLQQSVACFGDVHAVLTTPALLRPFLHLPPHAVLAWARSDELAVDSENSVVVALDCWCRGAEGARCDDATLAQLAALVRVRHLSPVHLFRLPALPWCRAHAARARHFALGLAARALRAIDACVPEAWLGPARQQLPHDELERRTTIAWDVPEALLAQAIDAQPPDRTTALVSPAVYAAGAAVCLTLHVSAATPAAPAPLPQQQQHQQQQNAPHSRAAVGGGGGRPVNCAWGPELYGAQQAAAPGGHLDQPQLLSSSFPPAPPRCPGRCRGAPPVRRRRRASSSSGDCSGPQAAAARAPGRGRAPRRPSPAATPRARWWCR